MSKEHYLKCHPQYFERVKTGAKTFEVRKNDRDFQTGDIIFLEEYDPELESEKAYTGNLLQYRITYILHGPAFGIQEGYCVMSINPL